MKYDDASWHYGNDFPADLPDTAGATHAGMFLAWALLSGLSGSIHIDDFPEDLRMLQQREITPGRLFYERCDGKFVDEDLNDLGNAFAESYYAMETGLYLADYEKVLCAGLPSVYHVADTWENFDKLKRVLDKRFVRWKRRHILPTHGYSTLELDIDGEKVNIAYRQQGHGPAILFVHGWMANSQLWREVFPLLPEGYRLVAIDLPGFGKSGPVPKKLLNLDSYASMIEAVITEISTFGRPKLVVADSFGALAVLHLVLRHSISADAVLLSGCPVDGLPKGLRRWIIPGLISSLIQLGKALPNPHLKFFIRRIFGSAVAENSRIVSVLIYCFKTADPVTAGILLEGIKMPFDLSTLPVDPRMSAAATRGERDRLFSREGAHALIESLGGKIFEIPNSGHIPMLENPAEYARAIIQMVESTSLKSPH